MVTDFLVVGGDLAHDDRRAAAQAADLVEVGRVDHVLDCRAEALEDLWQAFPAVQYRWDGIDDADQRGPGEWFSRITDWSHRAIESGGVVLTHCHLGMNRGPSAGLAVLLREGWDPIAALDAIRRARPIAVIAYAEDAVAWHLDRLDVTHAERQAVRERVLRWRRDNPLSLSQAIQVAARRNRVA